MNRTEQMMQGCNGVVSVSVSALLRFLKRLFCIQSEWAVVVDRCRNLCNNIGTNLHYKCSTLAYNL